MFGYVIDGVAIIDAMERAGDQSGRPTRQVKVRGFGHQGFIPGFTIGVTITTTCTQQIANSGQLK